MPRLFNLVKLNWAVLCHVYVCTSGCIAVCLLFFFFFFSSIRLPMCMWIVFAAILRLVRCFVSLFGVPWTRSCVWSSERVSLCYGSFIQKRQQQQQCFRHHSNVFTVRFKVPSALPYPKHILHTCVCARTRINVFCLFFYSKKEHNIFIFIFVFFFFDYVR